MTDVIPEKYWMTVCQRQAERGRQFEAELTWQSWNSYNRRPQAQ